MKQRVAVVVILMAAAAVAAGWVTLRHRPLDEWVFPGTVELHPVQQAHLWVRVRVPETLLGELWIGQRASIEAESLPGRSYPGRVVELHEEEERTPLQLRGPEPHPAGTFIAKIALDFAPELEPGSTVRVRLEP